MAAVVRCCCCCCIYRKWGVGLFIFVLVQKADRTALESAVKHRMRRARLASTSTTPTTVTGCSAFFICRPCMEPRITQPCFSDLKMLQDRRRKTTAGLDRHTNKPRLTQFPRINQLAPPLPPHSSAIRLVDLTTGKTVRKLSAGHAGSVRLLSFSADGRYLASSASSARFANVFDVAASAEPPSEPVSTLGFAATPAFLALHASKASGAGGGGSDEVTLVAGFDTGGVSVLRTRRQASGKGMYVRRLVCGLWGFVIWKVGEPHGGGIWLVGGVSAHKAVGFERCRLCSCVLAFLATSGAELHAFPTLAMFSAR